MAAEDKSAVLLPGRARPLGGYPHARVAGGLMFISGTSSRRPDDSIAGAITTANGTFRLDIREQTAAVIANLGSILDGAGASLNELVSITTYLVSMDDFAGYTEVYSEHFNSSGPARTTVAVHELPHPHLLIEMQAVAVLLPPPMTHNT